MSKVQYNPGISGINLYIDKKGRLIYLNPLTRKPVFVPKASMRKFNMYRSRYITVAAAFLIMAILFHDWLHWPLWIAVLLTLMIWAGFDYSFYRFVSSLPPVQKFDREKCRSTYDLAIPESDRNKAILRIVLIVAVGILLVINGLQMHYDSFQMFLCWAAMVCLFLYAAFIGWQLYRALKASKS